MAPLCSYKVPGQFVGVRLDSGGDGGVAGCLVAVSMEPTSVRQSDGKIQVLVTEEATFRLKGTAEVHHFFFLRLLTCRAVYVDVYPSDTQELFFRGK